ncbi:bacteriohemerythrin [Baaleninema sp.]|uniref:bacteriohemerythrin n=1 Tax=Baaleninema sp. TaxID=3101197 RepID=UPI003CFC78C1
MNQFTWDDSLEVGIPSLDNQHRHLVEQLSFLMETLYEYKSSGQVEAILNFLELYLDNHLKFEERCMTAYHCPAAQTNCIAHIHIRKTLKEVKLQFQKEGVSPQLVEKVQRNLYEWFVEHIRTIDIQLTTPVRSHHNEIARDTSTPTSPPLH